MYLPSVHGFSIKEVPLVVTLSLINDCLINEEREFRRWAVLGLLTSINWENGLKGILDSLWFSGAILREQLLI